jgi:hypothetical protein
MSEEKPPKRSRVGTAFGVLERIALFALSATVGIVDLVVALFVAAHLGVIPRKNAEKFKAMVAEAPLVGRLFKKEGDSKSKPKAKTPPAKSAK